MTIENGVIGTDDFPAGAEGEVMPEQEPQKQTALDLLLSFTDYHNLAEDLTAEQLAAIGAQVVREYEIDDATRAEWKERNRTAMKLARQVAEQKNYPWPKAANVKFPLITSASIQFASRAFPALVPNANVVKGRVIGSDEGVPARDPSGMPIPMVGPDGMPALDDSGQPVPQWETEPGIKQARADRIAAHMSYQLTEEMEEWEEDTDTLLHVVPVAGCAFRKTWHSATKARNCSAVILPDRLVVNMNARNLATAPRVTQEFDLYPFEFTEKVRAGEYLAIELGLAPNGGDDSQAP